jgi:hypothetical protein
MRAVEVGTDARSLARAGWFVLLFAAAAACRETPAAGARGAPAGPPSYQRATTRVDVTDADLSACIEWLRDWKALTNRHKAEGDEVARRAAARLSPAETNELAQDPEFLALLEQQGHEMQALHKRLPKGPTAAALARMVGGIGSMVGEPGAMGSMVARPSGVIYVPGRNETVLADLRKRYGDTFVDWVLQREAVIVETLSR